MSTVKEIFHSAIKRGDWREIRRVYEAITGEVAPSAPSGPIKTALDDVLNKKLSPLRRSRPLDQPMEMQEEPAQERYNPLDALPANAMAGSQGNAEVAMIGPRDDSLDLLPEAEESLIDSGVSDDPVDEFRIEQGRFQADTDEEGKNFCSRQQMNIPQKRQNRFHDDGTAFHDEKVTENPDDKSLGVQSVRPRGLIRDASTGADTSSTIEVTCSLCKRGLVVSTQLSRGYHKDPEHNTFRCNECSTPNGRAKAMRQQREESLNGGSRRVRQG